MRIDELRDALFEFIQGYFAGADVAWGPRQNATKPINPFLRLTMGKVHRPQHLITEITNEASRSLIPCTVILSVELFTHGREIVDDEGDSYFEDTAEADMMDFVNFMTSDYADDHYERLDINVRPEGDILPTSAVRDQDYEYRAKQDFLVSFMGEAGGYAGISRPNWKQTASGGGTEELANLQINDVDPDTLDIEQTQEE